MDCRVTYIYHNCFVLDLGVRTFLFDCPADSHLQPAARAGMRSAIRGKDLYVFVTHGHEDHFNPDLPIFTNEAAQVHYVFSDDIDDMYPESVPAGTLVVEPDGEYEAWGMEISTLMSNDLGVAFIIHVDGQVVYYGGDLAEWRWDDAGPRDQEFAVSFFEKALERISKQRVDIAFSNVDKRLSNLTGGVKFVRKVEPGLFVPMHAFGNTDWLDDFRQKLGPDETDVFYYTKSGESLNFKLEERKRKQSGEDAHEANKGSRGPERRRPDE